MNNPNARVSCTYKQFFEEAMTVEPKLRFVSQNQIQLGSLCDDLAVIAFLKEKPAPLLKEVLTTLRRYNEVLFKA